MQSLDAGSWSADDWSKTESRSVDQILSFTPPTLNTQNDNYISWSLFLHGPKVILIHNPHLDLVVPLCIIPDCLSLRSFHLKSSKQTCVSTITFQPSKHPNSHLLIDTSRPHIISPNHQTHSMKSQLLELMRHSPLARLRPVSLAPPVLPNDHPQRRIAVLWNI